MARANYPQPLHGPSLSCSSSDMAPHRLGHRASRVASTTAEDDPGRPSKRRRSRKQEAQVVSQSGIHGDTVLKAAEFKKFVSRLYLRNTMSGFTTQQLASRARSAGAQGVDDLANVGTKGKYPENMSRDILRNLRRSSSMPPLYYAQIPMKNPKTGANNELTWMPFLLVHEVMAAMSDAGKLFKAETTMSDAVTRNLKATCNKLGVDSNDFWPLGCHGDGVPNQAHKTVVCFTWNILADEASDRILFASLGKDYFCTCGCHGRHTFDAIMDVFVWSLNLLFHGFWPSARHDGTLFPMHNRGVSVHRDRPLSERWRNGKAGQPLGCKAVLQQCRGDWMWYKELFGFPSWASNQICWLCRASKHNFKDFGKNAVWRKERFSTGEFFGRQRSEGLEPSPLFNAIGFKLAMVMVDVLHCMDLGCSQDILGNIFWEALPLVCKGKNRKDQVDDLWDKIRDYYDEFEPSTKLQALTPEMVKQQKKGPKLRAKGAETRHLVPFGVFLAMEINDARQDAHGLLVVRVATSLFELYSLFHQKPIDAQLIGNTCRQLCLLYSSLHDEAAEEILWKVKPKFHMMIELCEYQVENFGSPEEFWAYRDESFVGFVAEFSRKRGGAANACSSCEAVLNRYAALS